MDKITQVKIQYRMEQWMQLIKEYQASGIAVRSWCRQNEIKESAYYKQAQSPAPLLGYQVPSQTKA